MMFKGNLNEVACPLQCCVYTQMNANYTIGNTTVANCSIDCTDPGVQQFFGAGTSGVSSVTNLVNGGCPIGVDPIDDDDILIGIGDDDLTVDDAEQISCDACQGGYPISQMFNYNPQNPQNGGCPQGWIPSGTGDPCEGQGTGCDFNPNGGCAQLHDLQGRL